MYYGYGYATQAPRLTLTGPGANPPIQISTLPLGLIEVQNNQPNSVLIQQAVLQRKDQATLLMMLQSITAPDLWPHVTPYEPARMTSGNDVVAYDPCAFRSEPWRLSYGSLGTFHIL